MKKADSTAMEAAQLDPSDSSFGLNGPTRTAASPGGLEVNSHVNSSIAAERRQEQSVDKPHLESPQAHGWGFFRGYTARRTM